MLQVRLKGQCELHRLVNAGKELSLGSGTSQTNAVAAARKGCRREDGGRVRRFLKLAGVGCSMETYIGGAKGLDRT